MTRRATTLLAMAAAMAATSMPGGVAAILQPYQRRAVRQLEKREPTADDLEDCQGRGETSGEERQEDAPEDELRVPDR